MTEGESKPAVKPTWRERLEQYGAVALVTYFVVFALTIVGFYIAISTGFEVEGVVGESSTWFAAWVATKLTQPIRIAVVLASTPIVSAVWNRVRGRAVKGGASPAALAKPESETRPD